MPLPGDIYQKYQEFKNEFKQSPLLGFMADVSECKTETAAIANVIAQYHFNFMSGDYDTSMLNEMNEKLKDAGINKVIEVKQRQLNEWLEVNKNENQ